MKIVYSKTPKRGRRKKVTRFEEHLVLENFKDKTPAQIVKILQAYDDMGVQY